jgi:hypothetical protein
MIRNCSPNDDEDLKSKTTALGKRRFRQSGLNPIFTGS